MDAAGVPTGRAVRAETLAEAERALDEFGAPYVVKADGLAAGKGVLVTEDRDAAVDHADPLAAARRRADRGVPRRPGGVALPGQRRAHVLPLSPAQDYKRLLDGDAGPNTGGMGAYSPLPWLPRLRHEEAFVDEVIDTIALPTVRQLAAERTPVHRTALLRASSSPSAASA